MTEIKDCVLAIFEPTDTEMCFFMILVSYTVFRKHTCMCQGYGCALALALNITSSELLLGVAINLMGMECVSIIVTYMY